MGPEKTGTTSLQLGLATMRGQLRENGVFLPCSTVENDAAHHILSALSGEWSNVPRFMRRRFKTMDAVRAVAGDFVRQVKAEAIRSECHTIVLSSEATFPVRSGMAGKLRAALCEITTNIQPVVYIREPADLYRSILQQRSKAGHFVLPLPLKPMKSPIEEIEREFSAPPIIRTYHRDQLIGGDILRDFCHGVLQLDLASDGIPLLRENVSLSAEAVFLLLCSGELLGNDELLDSIKGAEDAAQTARKLRATIRRYLDTGDKLTKLQLKPDVVQAIRASAFEYVWLKERFGIKFREIDYDIITEDTNTFEEFCKPQDVFEIDDQSLARLAISIIRELDCRNGRKTGPAN